LKRFSQSICLPVWIALGIWLLSFSQAVRAYFPLYDDLKNDFEKADAIVIGSVTKVERLRNFDTTSQPPRAGVCFLATLTTRKVLKGQVQSGSDILFYMGESQMIDKESTNFARPNSPQIWVCNDQRGWILQLDATYLLCLKPATKSRFDRVQHREDSEWRDTKSKPPVWEPQCFRGSIFEIIRHAVPEGENQPSKTSDKQAVKPTDEPAGETLRFRGAIRLLGSTAPAEDLDEFLKAHPIP
jgi:hypothetical protein